MTQRIPLASGRGFALVDDQDVALVAGYRWFRLEFPHASYACAKVPPRSENRGVRMHVLIMGRPYIDHINLDGLDNRRVNLRPATPGQQNANRRPQPGGTSRFKGVSWATHARRWTAHIQVNRHQVNLGYFTDEVEAALAYDAAALEAWGEYARPNFPPWNTSGHGHG